MAFPRLNTPPTLTDTVAKQLLAEIDAGRVLPGEKLPTETRLAEQFGVSRTVIREAVSRLRQDGIVKDLATHTTGTVVQPGTVLSRGCRCSAAHYETIIARFPPEEQAEMRGPDGIIAVDCAFCSRSFALASTPRPTPPAPCRRPSHGAKAARRRCGRSLPGSTLGTVQASSQMSPLHCGAGCGA